MYRYRAYELNIASEIQCPDLVGEGADFARPDVQILWGSEPRRLFKPDFASQHCEVKADALHFRVPDVAQFEVLSGHLIRVVPAEGADIPLLRLYLLGAAMGFLLHQRGLLVMHANGICLPGGVVLVSAPSGYGKSTLAAAFMARGYDILSDDVVPLRMLGRRVEAVPGFTQLKLWSDSMAHFDYDAASHQAIYGRETKYYVPAHRHAQTAAPVQAMYFLDYSDTGRVELQALSAAEKLMCLQDNIYRGRYAGVMGLVADHFQMAAKVLNQVPAYRLLRPREGFSVDGLCGAILENTAAGCHVL